MRKFGILSLLISALIMLMPATVSAGWVEGYWKSNGTYVNGYWKSNPNGLKYDNYSFDGNWADAYNDSYFSPTKNYSSDWYTPSWFTQSDYYVGKSFYDTRNSYSNFTYTPTNYSYNFLSDPIYTYTPSYNYGYKPLDLYSSTSSSYSNLLNSYSNSYSPYSSTYNSLYPSSSSSIYSNSLYSSPSIYSYPSYSTTPSYSTYTPCYSLYCN